jgi:hypothetical protein
MYEPSAPSFEDLLDGGQHHHIPNSLETMQAVPPPNNAKPCCKVLHSLAWFVWSTLVLFSLWLVVVNITATKQANEARDLLPDVFEELYRYIDLGSVCAFDNKGADSNISTFPDKDAAHEAGFLILHCGACWHNLSREYLTRNLLAKEKRIL